MANGIDVAQRVRVGVETEDGQILQFFSYIKKIYPDRLLLVFSETKASLEKYLQEGVTVRLSVYTPIGIILTSSVILNSAQNCEFEVEMESEPKRIQRRRYVRANGNFRLLIEQNGQTITALTQDIGGGGVRFICDNQLEYSFVEAKLFIPQIQQALAFSGDVEKKPHFKPNEYLIQFKVIDDATRNKIIQKCLEIEAEKIRKNN